METTMGLVVKVVNPMGEEFTYEGTSLVVVSEAIMEITKWARLPTVILTSEPALDIIQARLSELVGRDLPTPEVKIPKKEVGKVLYHIWGIPVMLCHTVDFVEVR